MLTWNNIDTECVVISPGILSIAAVLSKRDGGGIVYPFECSMSMLLSGNNHTIVTNMAAIWEPPFWLAIYFTIIRVTLNGLQVSDQH